MHCYEHGCNEIEGEQCAYVDHEGRHCLSGWCIEHQTRVDGNVYCRRHSGVMAAIAAGKLVPQPMPALDSRAASLVVWVSADLEAEIEELLRAASAVHEDVQIATGPVARQEGPGSVWERAFIAIGTDGEIASVGVEVDEHTDPEVAIRVNDVIVARAIPPWINRRIGGEWVVPDVDAEERKRFYRQLIIAAARALTGPRLS